MQYRIFYKNLKFDWILQEFFEPNASKIISKIIESTTNTSILSYGNFLCKNSEDLDIIYKILMEEYKKTKRQKEIEFNNLPNLFIESIKQLRLPNEND